MADSYLEQSFRNVKPVHASPTELFKASIFLKTLYSGLEIYEAWFCISCLEHFKLHCQLIS